MAYKHVYNAYIYVYMTSGVPGEIWRGIIIQKTCVLVHVKILSSSYKYPI